MRLSSLLFVMMTLGASAAQAHSHVRAFHSGRCLVPGGTPGVGDCGPGTQVGVTPVAGNPNRFMLRSGDGSQCLFSNKDGRFAWYDCHDGYDDQQWDLAPLDASAERVARDSLENFRQVRNVNSGKCLFSNSDGRFGVSDCVGKYSDQFWSIHFGHPAVQAFSSGRCLSPSGMADCGPAQALELVPGAPGTVMLKSTAANQCLFSNKDGRFAWYDCNPKFDDQLWKPFTPEHGAPPEVGGPEGGYRMLKGVHSGKCVFSNKDGRFAVYDCNPKFNDQFWHLVRTGE